MNLRNLRITDRDVDSKSMVKDGIHELGIIIEDNYKFVLDKEIGIEFNIGFRLGEPREYLVVYANPDYKNNPYIFVLKQTEDGRQLVKETTLETFRELADMDIRKEINKTLVVGFRNLPQYAFLGMGQIEQAREYAEDFDLEESAENYDMEL